MQTAGDLLYRFLKARPDHRAKQRRAPSHLSDRRPHELFEADVDRDRITRQAQERSVLELSEHYGFAGLHRHSPERDRS